MIRYDRNFHFCYIPSNSKVYTLNKVVHNQVLYDVSSPTKVYRSLNQMVATMQFYTVPYVSRIDNEPINVLFGFTSKEMCVEHLSSIVGENNEDVNTGTELTPLVAEYDLDEMKALSSMLNTPLIVEVAKKNDHYELFFYKEPIKNNNKHT